MTPTDYAAAMKKALEAGPTEGPYIIHDGRFLYALNVEGYNQFYAHVHGPHTGTPELEAVAALFAACHPAALRSLLDEREQSAIAVQMLTGEVERLRKDALRLDFIEKNARCDPKMDGNHVWWPTSFNNALRGHTLRAAIDAALKDTK